ncbi:SWIM zinc finger family protein [Kribbella sp. NPDC051620]|uniref:SWIM zinc finger family protein n=1 Tax=Kribbella sp. NPDC051620 TaxID=3364120 RepID=UPI0037B2FBF0
MSGEEARGFPAFPAQAGRSTRGKSWWGRTWVQALEDTSLDLGQLRKGRRTANTGQVGTITISPGRLAATVYAPDDTYEAVVHLDRLDDGEWERFLDQVAARAGHIAALLDGEMPHDLIDAASDAGIALLPGIGDLDPSCTCDSWELPCQHAAALCYQAGWLLDGDPFVLLLIRGRSRETLLDDLQRRSSTPPAEDGVPAVAKPSAEEDGVPAVAAAKHGGELPDPPPLPPKLVIEDLAVSGIQPLVDLEPAALPLLVLDAARRARAQLNALLSGAPDPWLLDEWQDSVRLAADYPVLRERLSAAWDRPAALALGVQAWSYGGAAALDVLENVWSPDPGDLARARTELLAAADDDIAITSDHNHLTTSGSVRCQTRLDHSGRWHPYRLVDDEWHPAGPPDRDPTIALAPPDTW